MKNAYDTVVGLEIHVQLSTNSKAFSNDKNNFGSPPNENIHPVSIALPGALPKTNRSQVLSAIKLGIALDSAINKYSYFDRKNYFYPDSPKGYQITQDGQPILVGGQFSFDTGGKQKSIRIHHVHMEDDAGKSIHDLDDLHTMIDLNRAGTPLLEVVTEPDFSSGQEVSDFLAAFQILIRYLEISDANMEEGSLRCDCNVSVKPAGQIALGTRCEIKNINSKKFAKIAISYERERQIKAIEQGEQILQETRLFDANVLATYSMRRKEEALDYRYYPDPDLQPVILSDELIENIKSGIDFLPWTAQEHLEKSGVQTDKAKNLTSDKNMVIYFITLNHYLNKPKLVGDFVQNHISPRWPEIKNRDHHVLKDRWVELLQLIKEKKISASSAYQKLIPLILEDSSQSVISIAEAENLLLEDSSEDELTAICQQILESAPDKVIAYKKGKNGLLGFFMGQAMRKGKSYNPKDLQKIFEELLN